MQLAVANARKTLETGVTTVRDLGAGGGLDITLRDEIAAGRTIGPRMFVAGQGISAGRGGGAPDPAAMQKTTEARLATTADWVKVYASRGSYQSVDTTQTIFFDELKAIVDTAHAKGPQGRDPFVRRLRREGRGSRRRRLGRARHRAGRRDDRARW